MTRDTRLRRSTTTQHATRQRTTSRRGFSLIEIILATAVLLGSVMVLSELAAIGRRQAQRARDLTHAQQLCTQQLNAMLVGLQPLKPVSHRPIASSQQLPSQQTTLGNSSDDRRPIDAVNSSDANRTPEATGPVSARRAVADAEWVYSVSLQPLHNRPGMSAVNVTVSQAQARVNGRRPVTFRLTRWIHDQPTTTGATRPGQDPLQYLSAEHEEHNPFGSPGRP